VWDREGTDSAPLIRSLIPHSHNTLKTLQVSFCFLKYKIIFSNSIIIYNSFKKKHSFFKTTEVYTSISIISKRAEMANTTRLFHT
jgi:hypothetical protein